MADREFQRRLSAVLAADVVGYTRLMEEDVLNCRELGEEIITG